MYGQDCSITAVLSLLAGVYLATVGKVVAVPEARGAEIATRA